MIHDQQTTDNLNLVSRVLSVLKAWRVQTVCLCPGSRNAPLVQGFLQNSRAFEVVFFFEERCASFFALGSIMRTNRPAVVVTTSGTAVGELLPATMEAYYSRLPLILLTADRPRAYRGTGAPQTAEQVGLFGVYASTWDWDFRDLFKEQPEFQKKSPLHWNVCFDEPLSLFDQKVMLSFENQSDLMKRQDDKVTQAPLFQSWEQFFKTVKRPLVIVGRLQRHEQSKVQQLLMRLKCPIYLESLSGLRECVELQPYRLFFADHLLARLKHYGYEVQGVLRLGGVPTLRFWRDLESLTHLPVLSLTAWPFSGLARNSDHVWVEEPSWLDSLEWSLSELNENSSIFKQERLLRKRFFDDLAMEPQSEPGLVAHLSRSLPCQSMLYLGNSLAIRHWDWVADDQAKNHELWGLKGLNGIDGQVSSFLGFAQQDRENWLLVGDLTALYDLAAPWVLQQFPHLRVNIVVMNNQGGQIFDRLYPQKEFQNAHALNFRDWAHLWQLAYERWESIPLELRGGHSRVIELCPDQQATKRFWKSYEAGWASFFGCSPSNFQLKTPS